VEKLENFKSESRFNHVPVSPKHLKNVLLSFYQWWALILISILLSFLCYPSFLSIQNLLNVIRQASLLYVISVGVTLTILTRGIDLSIGGVLAFSSCMAAWFLKMDIPIFIGIMVGLGLGGLCGLANGVAVSFVKIHPFIATYAMMWISKGSAYVFMKGDIIFELPPPFRFFGAGRLWDIPIPIFFAGLVLLVFYMLLHHTKFGKAIYGVGANIEAARLLGVSVNRTLIVAYTLSGVLAGLGGLLYISRLNAAEPSIGELFMLEAIGAAILGGTPFSGGEGGIINTISGVLLITLITNGMNMIGVSIYWQQFVLGTMVILGVLANQSIGRFSNFER
jgi:ribose transport system permease protein